MGDERGEERGEKKRSGVQEFFLSKVSKDRAGDMEADSRRWILQCPNCGHERSFWDIGGIRYKAVSKGKRTLLRCPNCGKARWHKVYWRESPLPEGSAPLPAAATAASPAAKGRPRWLLWAILGGLGIVALGIALFVGIFFLASTLVQPIVTVGDDFMAALKSENYTQAYALIAPDQQNQLMSATDLAARVRDNRPSEWSWSTRSIRNGVGRLIGSFTTTDGKISEAQITLREVGGNWRIVSFSLDGN